MLTMKKVHYKMFSLGWNFKLNKIIFKCIKKQRKEERKLSEIVKNTLRVTTQ